MSRKFVLDREIAFINAINKELIQNVVGQEVHYYAIIPDKTRANRLYNESTKKTWAAPVKLNALVSYDNPNVSSTQQGQDANYSAEIYCHTEELNERNVNPREGDFVEFGQIYFEITSVTRPQLVYGQVNNKIMTKLMCTPAREGQFSAGGKSSEEVDNTHPVEQATTVNR